MCEARVEGLFTTFDARLSQVVITRATHRAPDSQAHLAPVASSVLGVPVGTWVTGN